MEKDVFRFEDFLNDGTNLESIKLKLIKEGIFTEEEIKEIEEEKETEEINQDYNPYMDNVDDSAEEFANAMEKEDSAQTESKGDGFYKLYKDKSEDFICDIAVEGVDSSDTEVRLVIESDEWTLMFKGEIKNGKCIIPIKKLSILNEGKTGNIKLEVNAGGNLFTPWEERFVVKLSKKVTVKLNESKTAKAVERKSPGVKVNVKK